MWVKTLYTSTFILYSKKEQLNSLTFKTLNQYCAPPTIRSFQSTYWSLRTHSIIAGLSRARTARGTEPHTHRIWSTSFRLVVTWLTERAVYWPFTIWSFDSCQNRIATDQYHNAILGAHVLTHQGDVIYLEAFRWPVVLLVRNQCSILYFLAKLRAQENW